MLYAPYFDPVALDLGFVKIYWYGLCYIINAFLVFLLARRKLSSKKIKHDYLLYLKDNQVIIDILYTLLFGIVLGARIGYVIFYNFKVLWQDPLWIFKVWQGGMSFHGGLIGGLLAFWFYSSANKIPFLVLSDFWAPLVPWVLAIGRWANFVNGELYGRISHVPWAMIFIRADLNPRHPSQLYELLGEGIMLGLLMRWFDKKNLSRGTISAMFMILYALIRFILEFFREPDEQYGLILAGYFSMGQALSFLMLFIGLCLYFWCFIPEFRLNKKN